MFRLGGHPFLDVDEPVYAQVAREMVRGGDWLTPHLAGQLWFDKPPLFYWVSSLGVAVFGPTEFACRLPSALTGLGLVGLVYALAAHDFGRNAARFSAAVMATCLMQVILSRAAVTDMTFVFCLTLALYCYRRGLDAPSTKVWWAACGIATGLAMLTKGPVAPVLLGLTFAIHLWWIGSAKKLLSLNTLIAVFCWGLVGLPWYFAMYLMHGQEFVQGFLVANNLTRFLKAEHAHQTGHWYSIFLNVPVLLAFFFPWSVFLPQAFISFWRGQKSGAKEDPAIVGGKLLFVWFWLVFVFFSISKTQLITYIFPVYPAAAVFVGLLWSRAQSGLESRKGLAVALGIDLALAVALGVGLVFITGKSVSHLKGAAIVAGLLLLAMGLVAVISERTGLIRNEANTNMSAKGFWVWAGGMPCLAAWLALTLIPGFAKVESTGDLVDQLPDSGMTVGAYRVKLPSLRYYLEHDPSNRYAGTFEQEPAKRALLEPSPLLLICRTRNQDELERLGAKVGGHFGKFSVMGNAAGIALIEGKFDDK